MESTKNKPPKTIETIPQIETTPVAQVQKTYSVVEGEKLEPGTELKINGFLAVKTPKESDFSLVIDPETEATGSDSNIEQQLKESIQNDLEFMRSAYYNYAAHLRNLTVPDAAKLDDDTLEKLNEFGLQKVTATGSLKNVGEDERAKGMVLSRGDTLTEGEDIERRAEEIGLYSGVVVKFSDGPEKCIAATDAAGNHILMPHSDELEEILQAWFGYEKTDEPPFDAQAEFDKTEYGKAA